MHFSVNIDGVTFIKMKENIQIISYVEIQDMCDKMLQMHAPLILSNFDVTYQPQTTFYQIANLLNYRHVDQNIELAYALVTPMY